MALRFTDSFDHYATADAVKKGYSSFYFGAAPGDIGVTIGPYGRNGTNGLRCRSGAGFGQRSILTLTVSGVSGSTAIVGFAFKMNALPVAETLVASIWNDSAAQISITVSSGGALSVRRGDLSGTILPTTSATTLSAATFYFLELKVAFSNTVGTYELRIDGTPAISGSGVDTIASGSGEWDSIQFGNAETGATALWDYEDIYACDGSGSSENDFLGDYRSLCSFPSTGNGTHAEYTASTGSDHGALVDESTPNTTDFVSSSTVGQRDSYHHPALGVSGTVRAVVQPICAMADVAGVRQLVAICVIGGTTYTHPTAQTLGSDWAFYRFTWLTNPATGVAWTVADIDGAEFGHKIAA